MGGSNLPAAVLMALGLGVTAAACGSSSDVGSGAPAVTSTLAGADTTEAPAAPPVAPATAGPDRSASILPSVALTDVRSGATVDLASLVPAERPLLLWFWAPH